MLKILQNKNNALSLSLKTKIKHYGMTEQQPSPSPAYSG